MFIQNIPDLTQSGLSAFPEFMYLNSKTTQGFEQRCYGCRSVLNPRVHTTGYVPGGCCDVTLFLLDHPHRQGHRTQATGPAHGIVPWLFTARCVSRITALLHLDLWAESLRRPRQAPSLVRSSPALLPLVRQPSQVPQPSSANPVTRAQVSALLAQTQLSATTLGVHHIPTEPKGYSRCANVPQMCLFQEKGEGLISHL